MTEGKLSYPCVSWRNMRGSEIWMALEVVFSSVIAKLEALERNFAESDRIAGELLEFGHCE